MLNVARLMLIIQGKIQPYISTFASMGVALPHYTIWELLPLESEMLKGLTTGDLAGSLGLDVSDALKKRQEKRSEKKEKKFETTFDEPEGGFGAFEGTFNITIQDEESKITLRKWATADQTRRAATRKLLASLMSPLRYEELFGHRRNAH
jgi:hypothetical protein